MANRDARRILPNTRGSTDVDAYVTPTGVGIGTDSPVGVLHLKQLTSGFKEFIRLENNSGAAMVFDNTTGDAVFFTLNNAATEWSINWDDGDGEELVVDTSGNLTITGDLSAAGHIASAKQVVTLAVGVATVASTTSFMELTGDAGTNTLTTITGGAEGKVLRILCKDFLVAITDDNTHAADSVDLAAGFGSAPDTVLTLVYDGTSWYETGRSIN